MEYERPRMLFLQIPLLFIYDNLEAVFLLMLYQFVVHRERLLTLLALERARLVVRAAAGFKYLIVIIIINILIIILIIVRSLLLPTFLAFFLSFWNQTTITRVLNCRCLLRNSRSSSLGNACKLSLLLFKIKLYYLVSSPTI